MPAFEVTPQQPIREVEVSIQEDVKETIRFDEERFKHAVEVALDNADLYNEKSAVSMPKLDIEVTHIRVRSTFNAVMWGAMAGNDAIHGDIVIKDSSGKVLDEFTVKASYALGGLAAGQDGMRMDWLYEAFAKEVVQVFIEGPDQTS